jgi:hypothetical protein
MQREWFRRPDDERYETLAELADAADLDRMNCARKVKTNAQITIEADGKRLLLNAGAKSADFTPWAFSQAASVIGAPARYLAGLPATIAADAMNHGFSVLSDEKKRDEHSIMIRRDPATDDLTVRALNSTSYGQVWNAPIARIVERFANGGPSGNGRTWQTPPSWPNSGKKPGGLYLSDRDMVILQVDGGSIVNDPSAVSAWSRTPGAPDAGSALYRGAYLRNSEVGAATWYLVLFYFQAICGNHLIGGLEVHKEFKRRHTIAASKAGAGLDDAARYLAHDGLAAIARFMDTPASRDEQIIKNLAATELAATKEDTIAALKGKHGFTEAQATQGYDLAEKHTANPRSVWGIWQGLTRMSQAGEYIHNDTRLTIDQMAGSMLRTYTRQMVAA